MTEEHWFDAANKLLTHDAPRRGVLGTLALALGQRIGATDAVAKNGGKGGKNNGKGNNGRSNGKKKGKKSKKQKPKPAATCSEGACQREFVLPDNREWCEFICGQCDGDDPRDFCIVWAAPTDPDNDTKIADCCENGEKCCGPSCCPEGRVCCGGDSCCQEGHTCCGGFCCGTNNPYTTCCDGQCTNTEHSSAHCGACGNTCGPDEFCRLGVCVLCGNDCSGTDCPVGTELCSGRCRNTSTDPFHCGRCDNPCGPNERCVDGSCVTVCCVGEDGVTTCTEITGPNASNRYHCGGCNIKCPGNQSCTAGMCGCPENSGTVWCPSQELCINPSQC